MCLKTRSTDPIEQSEVFELLVGWIKRHNDLRRELIQAVEVMSAEWTQEMGRLIPVIDRGNVETMMRVLDGEGYEIKGKDGRWYTIEPWYGLAMAFLSMQGVRPIIDDEGGS